MTTPRSVEEVPIIEQHMARARQWETRVNAVLAMEKPPLADLLDLQSAADRLRVEVWMGGYSW